MHLPRTLQGAALLPLRVAEAGICTAMSLTVAGAALLERPVRAGDGVLRSVTGAVSEVLGANASRRCRQAGDRCWIEVRGLSETEPGGDLGTAVIRLLRRRPGVLTVKLNYPLSRAIVRVDPDSAVLSELCAAVATAERQTGSSAAPHQTPTDLPGDSATYAGALAVAALNACGLAVAVAGRVLPLPRVPSALNAVVNVVDYQPRLRRALEDRFGATAADTGLGLATALSYALTQAPGSLAVDLLVKTLRAAEIRAAAQAWARREPLMAERVECVDGVRPAPRPRPRPPGPVERYSDRAAAAQVCGGLAAGVIARDVGAMATAAVIAAPKAARNCRESFAASFGRGLADRGVLTLRPAALRSLDRIDAVVLDPRALEVDELRIGRIRDVEEGDRGSVWRWAQEELGRGGLRPGWQPVRGAPGEVLVRPAHHPLAGALIGELQGDETLAVSLDVESLDELRAGFDDLAECASSFDDALAGTVVALQRDGHTVAVVSAGAAQALADADVAIGIANGDMGNWHADLLCDDLAGVWHILHALPAARRASHRGVELAVGGSLLGALLMIPGVRGRGPGPVTAGAGAGAWTGLMLARSVLKCETPSAAALHEWHAMTPQEVRALLPAPPDPLRRPHARMSGSAAAMLRGTRSVAGPLARAVTDFTEAVRDELSDPLTPVLAVGAAASAVLGSPVDAVLVGSVLGGNAVLAAAQRVRAERLLRRLITGQDPVARRMSADGRVHNVGSTELRPGDVIVVGPGEVVPADARLTDAVDVEVDESALTGESLPVAKHVHETPAAPLAERACMLHATTTVVAGSATAIVIAVGADTQAHRAVHGIRTRAPDVGLQSQLRTLTNKAWPFSLFGGALVSGLGLLRRTGLREAVSSGVAVGVAAVPEGLPLVATLAQQASARRLTRCGVLVRAPRSVEALGRVDVVCFDKTGTLSENRLRVVQVHRATGTSAEHVLAQAGSATPPPNGDRHEHATDLAVAEAARSKGMAENDTDAIHLPFRSGRPFSASISGLRLCVKGAPEVVLAGCDGNTTADVWQQVQTMAADGLRVIAVAHRELSERQAAAAREDSESFAALCLENLRYSGLLGLSDTPRPDAGEVLASITDRGIGIRLITGDHPVTAAAIATRLGLPVSVDDVISGSQWESMPRRLRERAVREGVVFARMSPEHKMQVVETLEKAGQVCAMVGDGANDAAAIRTATVGVGVASRGSDPARTAADVMLLDGRISSLLDALDEGRQLWDRVQAAVAILLGGNAGEVAFAVAGTALTGRAPLNTRQLLLVNMLTDALPAAALAVAPPDAGSQSGARGPDQAALWRTVGIRGATTASAATAAWILGRLTGRPSRASTIALIALVAAQLGQTLIDSRSALVIGTAAGSLVALGVVISTPGVSHLLGNTPLGPVGWAQALSCAAVATGIAALATRSMRAHGTRGE
ncbi:HAD-IC family P-type ATPase [Mycobacterium aquaticum]|uniref:Haloacid dehalogenase n=1 Tax=Mycobacterium aquaticum TaxID=1927124 RepID=A0A1X0ACP3_9MYCO|nr:HAD-IC family P-type ATPase [Mycobacterium aquaticum]ORA27840.1 haloacid dehalogenase [Mycobacterium aquaticum]